MDLIQRPYCDFIKTHPERRPTGCSRCLPGRDRRLPDRRQGGRVPRLPGRAARAPLPTLVVHRAGPHRTRERKWAIPFVAVSIVLFLLGALAAYLTLPAALNFLLSVGGETLSPLLTVDKYVGFVIFDPRVRARVRVPDPADLPVGRRRPHLRDDAEVPATGDPRARDLRRGDHPEPDPISMLALLIPLYFFYEELSSSAVC